jgi:hypothetical protein
MPIINTSLWKIKRSSGCGFEYVCAISLGDITKEHCGVEHAELVEERFIIDTDKTKICDFGAHLSSSVSVLCSDGKELHGNVCLIQNVWCVVFWGKGFFIDIEKTVERFNTGGFDMARYNGKNEVQCSLGLGEKFIMSKSRLHQFLEEARRHYNE